jgi:hypothetical protein
VSGSIAAKSGATLLSFKVPDEHGPIQRYLDLSRHDWRLLMRAAGEVLGLWAFATLP